MTFENIIFERKNGVGMIRPDSFARHGASHQHEARCDRFVT